MSSLTLKVVDKIESIQPEDWGQLERPDFPFADYRFLLALEQSGSVAPRTGWQPCHLTLRNGNRLEAALALYSKSHSYGEYIFDWAWAEAYQRHGLAYYPKLTASSPFTPATGEKILIHPQAADRNRCYDALLAAARAMAERHQQSSVHFLYITPEERAHFERAGYLVRHSFQYHWHNQNYRSFEGFLQALKPRKRKQILHERAELAREGLTLRVVTGDALTRAHAEKFYPLYLSTTEKKQGLAYLTEDFFGRVFESMKKEVVLISAEREGTMIAGALYYQKGRHLYGRYWGATEPIRHLHFELCYYRPIEWAIENGINLFEAGAQGEHKIPRGFLPELTYSAHWIAHPQFRTAIASFIDEEKKEIAAVMRELATHSPYAAGKTTEP